jgi:hypothetical protein
MTTNMERTRLYVGLETQNNEPLDRADVEEFIGKHVEGGTFYNGAGLWKGSTEDTLIFESVHPESARSELDNLKKELADRFDQESVLLTRELLSEAVF